LPQGLRVSRRWLAVVLVLFCIPLFVGLRNLDLDTDEAIYSFAVEHILQDGEWLQPKSSPSATAVFLEKPPLKFWIVTAPIRAGLLPNDEFGLRFWDALFGALAFAYVFAIGSRLAGPLCGAVAVLVLVVHEPLIFEHGLRTNNMEGALFLAYCGGIFHFLEWGGRRETRRGWHAVAVGLYFTLGFLTKFVAAAFLPMVIGLAALGIAPVRERLWQDRGRWCRVAALALLLIVPWFVYAQMKFGSLVWHTMLAEHVYARFTVGLNREHVHPWSYYFTQMWQAFSASGIEWPAVVGLLLLIVQTIRRRWFEGLVVVLWAVLPLTLISLGSSKLYHYAYPFLPPIALAIGYAFSLIMMLAPGVIRRAFEGLEDRLARSAPGWTAWTSRASVQRFAVGVIGLATIVLVWTLFFNQARIEIGHTLIFKSGGILRPLTAIVVAAIVARRSVRVPALIVALSLAWWLPIDGYHHMLVRLTEQKHPLRDATDCIRGVEAQMGSVAPGLYVDSNSSMWHPITFYFERIQPWIRQDTPSVPRLAETLYNPAEQKPSLVQELRYRDYLNGPESGLIKRGGTPPMIGLFEYALLLPGPYRACSPEASLLTPR
jgi:4-amino-4-deoxy-L-arabinose transferase-like glycosyltransferase